MGIKGDKLTKDAELMANQLIEKLAPLGDVTSKKMFGGYGIFLEGKMFGLVDSKGTGFLKVDEASKAHFESLGSVSHGRMPYCSIPEDIGGDDGKLLEMAKKAAQLAK